MKPAPPANDTASGAADATPDDALAALDTALADPRLPAHLREGLRHTK